MHRDSTHIPSPPLPHSQLIVNRLMTTDKYDDDEPVSVMFYGFLFSVGSLQPATAHKNSNIISNA